MNEDDELRLAFTRALYRASGARDITAACAAQADELLALPEVAALRAQAAAAQQVRELHQPDEDGDCPECFVMFNDGTCRTIRALTPERTKP